MSYGSLPSGFARKPLAVILAEREQANIDQFGPGVVQTAQSPLGQLNGIFAAAEALLWEHAEDAYQSFDPEQAEGFRLDIAARLRLIERAPGESDFDLRRAVTNVDVANTRDADFIRALRNIDGVTFVRVYVNDGSVPDADGLPGHAVAVAVVGGTDEDVALVARRFTTPGINSYGNVAVQINVQGYCRTIYIIRPVAVPIGVQLDVIKRSDANDCPPPPNSAIAATLVSAMSGFSRPANGEDITLHKVRVALAQVYPNVEVVALRVARLPATGTFPAAPLSIGFFEIAEFTIENVSVFGV